MKQLLPNVVLMVLLVLAVSSLSAEVVTEATFGSGYQDNLFNDSNSTGDTYALAGMEFKYYPSSSIQFSAGAVYNAFAKYTDLSNLTGDISATFIPTHETSSFSLTLAGSAAVRKFGTIYELYDQVGVTVGADLGYRLTRWAHLNSSVSYLNTSYTNSDFGSNRGIDIATGVTFTVLQSNSLALRTEYSRQSFDQPLVTQDATGHTYAASRDDSETSETFEITGILLRYSRPLGERTGMNLSVGNRQLHVGEDYTVLGYTIDYLSPWANLWEGMSFSGGLKHFFPRQIALELSAAYFDKSFVDVVEIGGTAGDTYWQESRNDRLTTISLSVWRPVLLKNGGLLTPSINLGYRNNQSSTGFFEYEDIQASISLSISF